MGITSKIMAFTGSEPTETMKQAMKIGSLFVGLDVTFLNDAISSGDQQTEVLAGCTLTIVGMVQSSSDPYAWSVQLAVLEQDDPEDPPIIFSIEKLFEVTDLGFVLRASGGVELAQAHFSRYI